MIGIARSFEALRPGEPFAILPDAPPQAASPAMKRGRNVAVAPVLIGPIDL
jgi:hypothetical protein